MDLGAAGPALPARVLVRTSFGWSRGSTMKGGLTFRWVVHRCEVVV
jgi:hypothetical protein